MSENLITVLLILAVLLGVGSAAFLVMRHPQFWADVAVRVWAAVLPVLLKSSPETQAKAQDRARKAQEQGDARGRKER